MRNKRERQQAANKPKRVAEAPAYVRALVKHGFISKTLPIPDAYEVFLRVCADVEIQRLRNSRGHRMPRIPEWHAVTLRAFDIVAKNPTALSALKQRIEGPRS
jgi:hypothetical protein